MLLFFVHLRSQQYRTESHLQLSHLQWCHFDIAIFRWRDSQQTGAVRTTR